MQFTRAEIEEIYTVELADKILCHECSLRDDVLTYHFPPQCGLPKYKVSGKFVELFKKRSKQVAVRFLLSDGSVCEYNGKDNELQQWRDAVQAIRRIILKGDN